MAASDTKRSADSTADDGDRRRRKRVLRQQLHAARQGAKGPVVVKDGGLGLGQAGVMAFYHRGKERGCTHELLALFDEFVTEQRRWIPHDNDLFGDFPNVTSINDNDDREADGNRGDSSNQVSVHGDETRTSCIDNDASDTTKEPIDHVVDDNGDEDGDGDGYDDLEGAFQRERSKPAKGASTASFVRVPIDMDCVMFFKARSKVSATAEAAAATGTVMVDGAEATITNEVTTEDNATKEDNDVTTAGNGTTESNDVAIENKDSATDGVVAGVEEYSFAPDHRTVVGDPSVFVNKLLRWLRETGEARTRFTLRLQPVTRTCKATLAEIAKCVAETLDVARVRDLGLSYAVDPRVRYNDKLDRDAVVRRLGSVMSGCRVDLRTADITILVHVVRNVCFVGYAFRFAALSKHNVDALRTAAAVKAASVPHPTTDNVSAPSAEKNHAEGSV